MNEFVCRVISYSEVIQSFDSQTSEDMQESTQIIIIERHLPNFGPAENIHVKLNWYMA